MGVWLLVIVRGGRNIVRPGSRNGNRRQHFSIFWNSELDSGAEFAPREYLNTIMQNKSAVNLIPWAGQPKKVHLGMKLSRLKYPEKVQMKPVRYFRVLVVSRTKKNAALTESSVSQ